MAGYGGREAAVTEVWPRLGLESGGGGRKKGGWALAGSLAVADDCGVVCDVGMQWLESPMI